MSDSYVELREKYIYAKLKNLKEGDQTAVSEEVDRLLKANPEMGILIDDLDIRYKDLTPAIELEAVKSIKIAQQSPKVAVVINPDETKLKYFASFMLSTVRVGSMKVATTVNEAIEWLTADVPKTMKD